MRFTLVFGVETENLFNCWAKIKIINFPKYASSMARDEPPLGPCADHKNDVCELKYNFSIFNLACVQQNLTRRFWVLLGAVSTLVVIINLLSIQG